tara:strand:+ start:179 stop:496 length:318 start_codon:yes stop_codon:yes gene_type:complete
MSNELSGGATYEPVDGQTYNGQQVYIFKDPCETMVDRSEVSLQGAKFIIGLNGFISCDTLDVITVLPESYDLLRPRIGEWHWRNWVFDGGLDLQFGGEWIEPSNR